MKFTLAGEHRHFFRTHQSLELEGILSAEECELINSSIDEVLIQRLHTRKEKLPTLAYDRLLKGGRDLWRESLLLKKWISSPRLAGMASDLFDTKPIRIGYDQILLFPTGDSTFSVKDPDLAAWYTQTASLEQTVCLQGLVGGIIISLTDLPNPPKTDPDAVQPASLFPTTAGHGVFFSPQALIDYPTLLQRPGQRYYLMVYTQQTAVYTIKEKDPFAATFRAIGYCPGDCLLNKWNPIIY